MEKNFNFIIEIKIQVLKIIYEIRKTVIALMTITLIFENISITSYRPLKSS